MVVTGSGALELKEKVQESLAGRKRIFHLHTLSFTEFVHHRLDQSPATPLPQLARLYPSQVKSAFIEYLNYGGYPQVVLASAPAAKKRLLAEIYTSYAEKDIQHHIGKNRITDFTNLIKILADQVGQLLNKNELASTLGISAGTIHNYLWYLEKTHILTLVRPFYRQPKLTRSYHHFITKYQPKSGYLYNLDTSTQLTTQNTIIKFLAYYQDIPQPTL